MPIVKQHNPQINLISTHNLVLFANNYPYKLSKILNHLTSLSESQMLPPTCTRIHSHTLTYLFSETYAENSRIPEMSFGTPEQDAMRRDLTINSLFYNIHTKSVEDYSGRGVQDLKTGENLSRAYG